MVSRVHDIRLGIPTESLQHNSPHCPLNISAKAKRELKEQQATLIELRKLAEESERKGNAFTMAEQALKVSKGAFYYCRPTILHG